LNLNRAQRGRVLILACSVTAATLLLVGLPTVRPAQAQEATAALPGDTFELGNSALPQPLQPIDADRYRQIFKLQSTGDYRGADALIADLTDQSLLGHVLADRYLSRGYRSSAKELTDWMKLYSALPDAELIYALAQRKGAKPGSLMRPQASIARTGSPDEASTEDSDYWQIGLENWSAKNFGNAAQDFVQAAGQTKRSSWDRSAAAFWAARAYLRDQRPEQVSRWLREASHYPRTFYGQLAQRALGIDPVYDWTVPDLSTHEAEMLMRSGSGKRALALIEIGQIGAAEKELLLLANDPSGTLDRALLEVSQASGLPSLALKVGSKRLLKGDDFIDAAMFPVPAWAPSIGYTVDRALLFAIMRQESGFNPNATSQAGAVGLMQLMPETAKLVSGESKPNLHDPLVSIGIGQKYIAALLQSDVVGNDLFMLAAAYNAGPGNLQKWRSATKADEDPLFFVESLPSRETRLFVERIMASYWIYQNRLSQTTDSLDAVASGASPIYDRQDGKVKTAAAN
jgi:soluble lytic murein transglycosylase-like protein